MSTEHGWWYILPSIEVKHKYWYLWQVLFSWGKWAVMLDICKQDRNDVLMSNDKMKFPMGVSSMDYQVFKLVFRKAD